MISVLATDCLTAQLALALNSRDRDEVLTSTCWNYWRSVS